MEWGKGTVGLLWVTVVCRWGVGLWEEGVGGVVSPVEGELARPSEIW